MNLVENRRGVRAMNIQSRRGVGSSDKNDNGGRGGVKCLNF